MAKELHPFDALMDRFSRISPQLFNKKESLASQRPQLELELNNSVCVTIKPYEIAKRPRTLPDGTKMHIGEQFGAIDFMPMRKEGESMSQYWKRAHTDLQDGLQKLAHVCEHHADFAALPAFGGITRLHPLLKKKALALLKWIMKRYHTS